MQMKNIVAVCSAMLGFGLAAELEVRVAAQKQVEESSPKVGDWMHAEWFDDLVKIPLTIDDGTNWYANLIVGPEDT